MRTKADKAKACEELVGIEEKYSEAPTGVLRVLTMECDDPEAGDGSRVDIIEVGQRLLRDIKAMELDDAHYIPSEDPGKIPSPSLTTITDARDIMNTYMAGWNLELKKVGHSVNIAPFSDEVFTTTVNYGIRVIREIVESEVLIVPDFQQFYRTTNSCISLVKNEETRTALGKQLETTVTGMYSGIEEARKAIEIPSTEKLDSAEAYEARTTAALEALNQLFNKSVRSYECLKSIKEKEIAKKNMADLDRKAVAIQRTAIGVIEEEITYLETEDNGPDKDVTAKNPDRLLTLYAGVAGRYKRINDKPNALQYTRMARIRVYEAEMDGLEEIDERELEPNEVLRLDELYRALQEECSMLGDDAKADMYSKEIAGLYERVGEAKSALGIAQPLTLDATLGLDGRLSFDLVQNQPDNGNGPTETE